MKPTGTLTARLVTPLLALAFCLGFLNAISGMDPEAASYPRLVIWFLFTLIAANVLFEILGVVRERAAGTLEALPAPRELLQRWHRPILSIVLLALYIYAMPRLGFYPATAAFLLLLLPAVGLRRPLPVVAMTAGLLGASYVLFGVVLQVLLPRGPFG
jgi:hypothetical protein